MWVWLPLCPAAGPLETRGSQAKKKREEEPGSLSISQNQPHDPNLTSRESGKQILGEHWFFSVSWLSNSMTFCFPASHWHKCWISWSQDNSPKLTMKYLPSCVLVQKVQVCTPSIQLHCGLQVKLWILARGLSRNATASVLKEGYSAQDSGQEESFPLQVRKTIPRRKGLK